VKLICDDCIKRTMHAAFVSSQMANDPERDLLPVKDGVLCERQRNMSTFSLNSERGNQYKTIIHFVC
jgi:hypothetical protein